MQEKTKVYVFGHQNPDTDSICAALSYAYFKNQTDPEHQYIPTRLGEVNSETEFILEHFKIEAPLLIKNLKPQVSDIKLEEVACAHEHDSIKETLQTIVDQVGRSLPVVDRNERLIGVVSISDVVPLLLESHKKDYLMKISLPIKNLVQVLDLAIHQGTLKEEMFHGTIHIFNDLNEGDNVAEHDLIICNRLEYEAGFIKTLSPKYILIGDMEDGDGLEQDPDYSGLIFYSSMNTYELVQGISKAFPILPIVKKEGLEYFTTYETLEDVMKNMVSSKHRRFPVVDEWGYIQGMLSRSHLMEVDPKHVILVDHNEKGQSIEGIESVRIMEVIDHHRVADIQTMNPLYFRVEPVGSTNTIVAKHYFEHEVEIPREIAGIMLSGILSDTLLFKSPTCTPIDQRTAHKLAEIAEVNLMQYGMMMITKGEKLNDVAPEKLISGDMKRFTFGTYKVAIAQINIGDFEAFFEIYPAVKDAMRKRCEQDGLDLFVLMVTSIVMGGSELIAVGEAKWIAENAFQIQKEEDSIFQNAVFSRKKQIVPKLMQAAQL